MATLTEKLVVDIRKLVADCEENADDDYEFILVFFSWLHGAMAVLAMTPGVGANDAFRYLRELDARIDEDASIPKQIAAIRAWAAK